MDVNKKVIEGKIDVIERNLRFLEQYKEMELKAFENSYKDIQAVKYSLLEIVESSQQIRGSRKQENPRNSEKQPQRCEGIRKRNRGKHAKA